MRRLRRFVAPFLVAVLAVAALAPAIASADDPGEASVVVVVLAPYMTWEDLDSGAVPNLRALAERSALGNLNTRSRALGARVDSLAQAGLMFSAGSWVVDDPGAPGAYNVDEHYETGDVAEAYLRFTGHEPGDSAIAYLGLPRAQRANQGGTIQVVLGAVGSAIQEVGGATAAVGNSDTGYAAAEAVRDRPAALAAMNASGVVDFGDVSRRLIRADDTGPYGLSTDLDVLESAYAGALADVREHGGPGLIVVDPGDAHRAADFAEYVSSDVAEAHRVAALETLDHAVGLIDEDLPSDAVMIVASTVPVLSGDGPRGLAPCIVSGAGWQGFLESPSTHRTGLVTLTDLSVTVLDVLGIEAPVSMIGSAMRPCACDDPLDERVASLMADDATAVSIDGSKPAILNTYIGLTVALIIIATLFVVRRNYPRWLAVLLRAGLLLALSVPLATYVMFAAQPRPGTESSATLLFLGTTLGVWVLAALGGVGGRRARPLAIVTSFTALVLILDPWLGGPLSFTGYLSFSPLAGARFFGMGNEAAGLLFGSLLVGATLWMDERPDAGWVRHYARWGIPALGAITVWTAISPDLGANVGVAAWGVVAVAVLWAAANGIRISWRLVLGVVLIVIVLVAAIAVLDLGGQGTHLARAIESTDRGGLQEFGSLVMRKIETNIRVLTHTNWAYVLLAVLGLLAVMRWRPRGEFMEALSRYPYFAHAMTALLVGGLAAYFTEDSGIVIPALMLLYPGVGVLYLMLGRGSGRGAA